MRFVVLLSAALVLSSSEALGCSDQCCDLNCWEQCFSDQTPTNPDFYQQVYQMVQTIRDLYSPCSKPHGTCYLLDSSLPSPFNSELMDFERNLASIIALTQPVSNDCNPFFVNKFHRSFAWYAWNWQCQDKCNAARTLATTSMQSTSQNSNLDSWIGGGCHLCDHAFNNPGLSCSDDTEKELLVAFANSGIYSSTFTTSKCNSYNRVIIGTTPATTWPPLAAWASPGLAYQLEFNSANLKATKSLLSCMNRRCCPDHSASQFPLRSAEEKNAPQRFSYNTGDEETPKEFAGTFDEFEKSVLNKLVEDPCKDKWEARRCLQNQRSCRRSKEVSLNCAKTCKLC